MIYLATPYSHEDPTVREMRFQTANAAAAKIIQDGHHVFSPISHTHPIAEAGELPKGWDFWKAYDRAMLNVCDELHVLTLDGWQESIGVTAELEIAKELSIPICFIDPKPFIPKRDWRVGVHVKPKLRDNPLHGLSGIILNVFPSGHHGIEDRFGVLLIKLPDITVFSGSSNWITA